MRLSQQWLESSQLSGRILFLLTAKRSDNPTTGGRMKNLTVGNISISRVVEMEGPFLQPQQLLPEAKAEVIESHKHWLAPHFMAPDGMFIMSIHTWLTDKTMLMCSRKSG
jgi:hypothetical protein